MLLHIIQRIIPKKTGSALTNRGIVHEKTCINTGVHCTATKYKTVHSIIENTAHCTICTHCKATQKCVLCTTT